MIFSVAWCIGSDQCTFGHYASYLEVSFAINVLVAGWWDRLRRRLRRLLRESKRKDSLLVKAMKADLVDEAQRRLRKVDRSRELCKKWTGVMVAIARAFCFALALLIAAALLLIEGASKVPFWLMAACLISPVVLTVIVYVVDSKWSSSIEKKAHAALDEVLREADEKTKRAEAVEAVLPTPEQDVR